MSGGEHTDRKTYKRKGETKMNRTKTELKEIAATALRYEYGFAPAKKDVVLLEASGDGTYILFDVNGIEYRFLSNLTAHGAVYCGQNTVERIGGYLN